MRQKLILSLSCGFLLTLLSFFSRDYFKSYSDLPRYQKKIERHIRNLDARITQFLEDEQLIHKIISGSKLNLEDISKIKKIKEASFTICFYKDGEPIFWTNTLLIPEKDLINPSISRDTFIRHSTGYYWLKSYSERILNDQFTILGVIPVKYEYATTGSIFQDFFPASNRIPDNLRVTTFKTKYPIHSPRGQPIAYLQAFNLKMKSGQLISFLISCFSFLFYGLFIHYLSRYISRKGHVLLGVSILLLGIVLLRFILHQTGLTDQFNGFFDLDSDLGRTAKPNHHLGDTLLNIVLLFWLLLFTYRQLKVTSFEHLPLINRTGLAALNHFSILLGMVMFAGICKNLVLHTGIEFDFDNVFNLNPGSFFALVGVILFLLVFFIVSHRMTLTVKRLQLNLNLKLASIGLSFILIYPIFWNVETGFPIYIFYLVGIVYLLLFDLFVDTERPNITWMVIWLVVFAGFSSIVLYKYKKDVGIYQRIEAAEALINLQDSVLLQKTLEMIQNLPQESRIRNILLLYDDPDEKVIEINKVIQNNLEQNHYVNDYYAFDINTIMNINADVDFADSIKKSDQPVQFYNFELIENRLHQSNIQVAYFLQDTSNRFLTEIEFRRKRTSNQPEFSSLLYTSEFKGIEMLSEYDYAIYGSDTLLESRGHIYERLLSIAAQQVDTIPREIIHNDRTELVYKQRDYTVLMGRELSGILKPLSLFSYLFAMLVTAILLLMLLNSFYPVFPETIRLSITRKLSLRNKIQISVLALIIVSFICVGVVTVIYFNNSANQYDRERLMNKAVSVQFDAQKKLSEIEITQQETDRLHEAVQSLSQIHQTDINLYNKDGHLLQASDLEIFKNKLVAPYMNPIALKTLTDLGNQMYINERETLGALTYKAAFLPVFNEGALPTAYISLPYSSASGKDQRNVKGFMGTLLNVYVFLLLIAGAIAIAVANSITRPISELGEKIRAFKLGKRNEPILWNNNDELGALIQEYNFLIDKMEKSAELLAQNEREVAWREMAKQVAHEIKNPLTPMKLSIQHLQHKIAHSPPEEMEPLINRVASTLIEQIDNLTRIASEFSNFSKLPKPNNEKIILNDLIASVHDLFRKREDIIFNLYVPIDEIYIFADRSHILRILNNLIKNAIQAIPAIRKGKVDIKLYTKNKRAVIQVSDNGAGIAPEMQDKVFYPNFTTKSSGTGLGLAISKDIAEAYGGSIKFKTEENKGTDFYFEMPLMTEKDQS